MGKWVRNVISLSDPVDEHKKGPVSSRCSLAGIGSKFDSEPLKNPRWARLTWHSGTGTQELGQRNIYSAALISLSVEIASQPTFVHISRCLESKHLTVKRSYWAISRSLVQHHPIGGGLGLHLSGNGLQKNRIVWNRTKSVMCANH